MRMPVGGGGLKNRQYGMVKTVVVLMVPVVLLMPLAAPCSLP